MGHFWLEHDGEKWYIVTRIDAYPKRLLWYSHKLDAELICNHLNEAYRRGYVDAEGEWQAEYNNQDHDFSLFNR